MATSPNKKISMKNYRNEIALALVVLVSIAVGAGMIYYLNSHRMGSQPTSAPASASVPVREEAGPFFVPLEPFTVNVRQGQYGRFLHVGMTLRMADAASQAQITQYLPEVRNRIVLLLSDRPSETLMAPSEKTKLANEIMATLNTPLTSSQPPQRVTSVAFTAFVLQ